jgi:ribonuclease Z
MRLGVCVAVLVALVAAFVGALQVGVFDALLLGWAPAIVAFAIQHDRIPAQQRFQGFINDDSLHVMLCGTSSPFPDPDRAGPCTLVMGGGELFIVDTGPASVRKMGVLGVNLGRVTGIFLTHYHSDHIGDFGEAVVNSWIQGRREPVPTYGPPGVKNIVEGFGQAYAMDQTYRTAHHEEANMPEAGSRASAVEFPLPPPGGAEVLTTSRGIKVTTFEMDHWPVHPAVGYRFEFHGRTVVVTGDGEPFVELARQHEGADLVVRNTISKPLMEQLSGALNATGGSFGRLGKMTWDTLDYHSDPAEAMEDAVRYQTKLLVICHFAPPTVNLIQRLLANAVYRKTPAGWGGGVAWGKDGDHWVLPQGTDEIHRIS